MNQFIKCYIDKTEIVDIIARFEKRIYRKRGAHEMRTKFYDRINEMQKRRGFFVDKIKPQTHAGRRYLWGIRRALSMCAKLNELHVDEHGTGNFLGDELSAHVLEYRSWHEGSHKAPFCDMGGEGLALVKLCRTRYYSKAYTSRYGTGSAYTVYLVGKNEAGTYFCHAVNKSCRTLRHAMDWIWSKHSTEIIQRQGDIALIKAPGPKIPKNLPSGHVVDKDAGVIKHATHPDLPLPKNGERIILGRRANTNVGRNARD
jgi:hypothetical protein